MGPEYKKPDVSVPITFRSQINLTEAGSFADQPWWAVFGDPVLTQLIDQALQTGYEVQIAAARVEEARSRAGIARSQFFPQIGYGADWSRGRTSVYLSPNSTATRNLSSVNVKFGWDLDICGRLRRQNEAAKAQ